MPRDLRMSRMLHVLIHMDRHVDRATSEQISKMISTNPVVVRRMMAGLREKGVVTSEKGHGGGWQLARSLADISLRDVYDAIGRPPLFNIGAQANRPSAWWKRPLMPGLMPRFGRPRRGSWLSLPR